MKWFLMVLMFSSVGMAKSNYSIEIVSDAGKKIERVEGAEIKKMYPVAVGSKNNLCFLMKNDETSLTLFCRAYPMIPSGPKDKNYSTVSQHITCSSSKDTSLSLTDAKTEKIIMLTVTCEQDKI